MIELQKVPFTVYLELNSKRYLLLNVSVEFQKETVTDYLE